jgi:2',3'-cyclic-nucleotide 2'-phosphodiesterase (5'-nucleotidase family)
VVRRANFYKKVRDPNANWLTLDIGNSISAESNKQCSPKCNLMLQSFQAMKYDVMGVGTMELGLGSAVLKELKDTLGIPLVCANVLDIKTRKPVVEPYIIRRYGNMVIGITGLVKDDISTHRAIDTTQLVVMPQLDVARELIPRLHQKVDAILLLCDFGNKEIDTLLQVVPQIEAIFTSGSVQPFSQVTKNHKTLVVPTLTSTGQNGTALTLEFNPAWKDSLGYTVVNTPLTEEFDGDNPITKLMDTWKESTAKPAEAITPATAKPISLEPAPGATPSHIPSAEKSKTTSARPGNP